MMALVKRKRSFTALLLAGFAAGCAGESAEQLFVQPGRFDYLSCSELVFERQKFAEREQELKSLIDRAETESFGVLLAAGSYRGEYLQVQGEQRMLAGVMERKGCPADAPPRPPELSRSLPKRR